MSRLTTIRHVRQRHSYGCVIASLAMVAGRTYDEVAADYPWFDENKGVDLESVGADFLWRHGFAWQVVYPYRPGRPLRGDADESHRQRARSPWPPAPWAAAHLCQVEMPGGSHCVVMRSDGSVLDPLDEAPRTLDAYRRVNNVRGLYDVAGEA